MIIRAELVIEAKTKIKSGTSFTGQYASTPKSNVQGTVKGDRLIVETSDTHCRDQIVPYFAAMFRDFYDRYPEKRLSAYGDLSFEISPGKNNLFHVPERAAWPYKAAIREVLGKRKVSPLVSPYILRYIIGRARKGSKDTNLDWFASLMLEARKKNIDFNRNLFESWSLDMKSKAELEAAYGFMGLNTLQKKIKPLAFTGYHVTVPDYELVFPAAKFIKEGGS